MITLKALTQTRHCHNVSDLDFASLKQNQTKPNKLTKWEYCDSEKRECVE